ncbi:hypothetical protein QBC35DRAFT_483960 [Podospora australis]|uniref:Transmembrane protein n=1 Tax=Podospora australis TaxID=1536484 RepID=A0AAN6X420_9PEZI|nr:hypothetical protein QBC35DRAFT_483960 [Podospora australis]
MVGRIGAGRPQGICSQGTRALKQVQGEVGGLPRRYKTKKTGRSAYGVLCILSVRDGGCGYGSTILPKQGCGGYIHPPIPALSHRHVAGFGSAVNHVCFSLGLLPIHTLRHMNKLRRCYHVSDALEAAQRTQRATSETRGWRRSTAQTSSIKLSFLVSSFIFLCVDVICNAMILHTHPYTLLESKETSMQASAPKQNQVPSTK